MEHPKLGMEAIWPIEVEDFPAFIVIDDKGNFSRNSISAERRLQQRDHADQSRYRQIFYGRG